MVRTVEKKYQVWLAGYYDDFNGARAIPDDRNKPTDVSYSVTDSHFGNPMNGEAFINPRFRFSIEERTQDSANKVATTSNQYLQNDGIFEWLTWDDTRLSYDDWEGRVQLQYPDGHVANRYKFDNDASYGSDFYQRFINGHNSDASYIVPTGDNDATHGHSDMRRYIEANYALGEAGRHTTTGNFAQRAHLTGVWMGERLTHVWATPTPEKIYQEIHSPAKKPFLCIQAARKADTNSATTPSIIYDGHLNSRIDGDIFTARIALQSGLATATQTWPDVGIKFEIGFPVAQAGILNDSGYTGTAAITYTLDLDAISYDTEALLGGSGYNTPQVSIDDVWIDVDFVFDYASTEFDVYVDGTLHEEEQAMNGGTTAADLYGYQLTVTNEGSSGTNGYVSYLMLDRVGLVRYITDDFTSSEETQVIALDIRQANNGISSCKLTIADDPDLTGGVRGAASNDYLLSLRSLFVASSPLDWGVLVFADTTSRIDRPVWRGEISNYTIKQKRRSREMIISADDSISMLNRQIPLWDVGQKGEDTDDDPVDYWGYDSQGFRDSMYLGGGKLKLLGNDVGFDTDSSYLESATQRMQLGSGHPIQMYNNEDSIFGPNDAENDYEGVGILGITEEATSTSRTTLHLVTSSHGITTSSLVTVKNTAKHNTVGGKNPHSVSGNKIIFDAADIPYASEPSRIVYIGKYPVLRADGWVMGTFEWAEYQSLHPVAADLNSTGPFSVYVYFDTDPSLSVGDYFYINNRNMAHTTFLSSSYQDTRHRVDSVATRNSISEGVTTGLRSYFSVNNSSDIWIVKTNVTYDSTVEGTYGNYATDSLLTGNSRFEWSKDIGHTEGIFPNYDLRYRALHTRWMRDLPLSLWFKYHFGLIKKEPLNEPITTFGQVGALTAAQHASYCRVGVSQTLSPTNTVIEVDESAFDAAPNAGVAEIWTTPNLSPARYTHATEYKEKFVYRAKVTTGSGGSQRWYLIGVKHINGTYAINSSYNYSEDGVNKRIYLRFQDFEDSYKHLWLLWADMRNNGEADADASERKEDFGLQYPTNANYEIDLFYADQFDADGNIDKFANLHIGEDLDIWNVDSTTDPITGGAFSKPVNYENKVLCTIIKSGTDDLRVLKTSHGLVIGDYISILNSTAHDGFYKITGVTTHNFLVADAWTTGSTVDTGLTGGIYYFPIVGSNTDLTEYRDWEDKAGALLLFDAAKFFNLNSNANSGKTGQDGGGRTDLTDYIATGYGFPKLIDNYWAEVISSYQTTPDEMSKHPAQYRLISDATLATDGFPNGYIGLPVDNASNFDDTGAGKLVAVMSRNANEETSIPYYFVWNGKLDTEYSSDGGISTPPSPTSYEGETVIEITNVGETHSASGLSKGMTLKRIPSGGDEDDITVHTILRVVSDTQLTVTKNGVTWGAGDTYTVPVQLAMVYAISLEDVTGTTSDTRIAATALAASGLTALEDAVWEHFHNQQLSWSNYGLNMNLGNNTDTTPEAYEVHATVSSQFMLRLLMHIEGFYKSKNGGTYWDSDKIRMLWNAAIMDTWLPSARVGSIYDINNVPVTKIMTTYSDTSSNDSYGSIVDSRGKTLGAIIDAIQEKAGYGSTNGNYTTFSYLIGRDNRFEFRPKYNSGIVFNRDNISLSSLTGTMDGQITNVRVYYNKGKSFVDWPSTNLTDSTRWKIVEYPSITSSEEALLVAQQEYNKKRQNPLKLTIEPMLEGDVEHKMIESGRYGYIADPYIALYGKPVSSYTHHLDNCCNWSVLGTGGALFPGMVNALDGNMNVDIDPLKTRWGSSKDAQGGVAGNLLWGYNYYWYGSNSISNAVQIVHIPNKTPLVSDETGQPLRIWIDLKTGQSGTDIDNAEFSVYVSDYSFSGITRVATLDAQTSKDVKHSGYYEIAFPSNYGAVANAKIVFSFNAEYCRALLRHRCGNPTDANILTRGGVNTHTIFPLGKRAYTEMGGGFRDGRVHWYAPRIHVCRDLSYVPATYVSVTDAGLELNAESMVINNIKWYVKAGQTETVTMDLERDESLAAGGLISYLFPDHTGDRQQGSDGGGGGDTGGDTGGGSIIPPQNDDGRPTDPRGQQKKGYGATKSSTGTSHDNSSGIKLSRMSSSTVGRIKGRMDLPNDDLSGDASFSILGQRKPAVTPSTMRGIEGMDVDIRSTSGTASVVADGYVFGGKGLMGSESAATSQEVSMETAFVLPKDVLSNRLNIQATLTHSPNTANNTQAVLYVTALIEETNESITNTVNIGTGVKLKIINLLPTTALKGLNIKGNHIRITITRKPGMGNDDADTTSVTLHNLDVKTHRASAHTRSNSSQFSTFS